MEKALDTLCARAEKAVHEGHNIIILSDRAVSADHPDPVLAGLFGRAPPPDPQGPAHSVGLVVETGEAREVHQFATLAGYGAEAINPYLAFDTIDSCCRSWPRKSASTKPSTRYIKAVDKGLLKVMSKMGISTYQSYCGAQIFDAVGLNTSRSSTSYFTGTATQVEGVGLPRSRDRGVRRHQLAYDAPVYRNAPGRGRRIRLPFPRRGATSGAPDRRQPAARGARQHS
jgi:glutamate synthase (NADPH/NADH) large chain